MKIAILGAGNIGGTLGKKWQAAGHEVIFGVRESHSAKTRAALENAGGKIRAVDVDEALRFGQIILVSIPYGAVPELLAAHAAGMENKTILDATNNFGGTVINNLERIREKVPSAALYRAFNSLRLCFAKAGWGSGVKCINAQHRKSLGTQKSYTATCPLRRQNSGSIYECAPEQKGRSKCRISRKS